MKILTHSLHKFNDIESIGFSATNYSRVKYGSVKHSRKFGKELAENLIIELNESVEGRSLLDTDIVVCSAPYKYLPVAATSIGDHFTPHFNYLKSELDFSSASAQNLKVSRGHSYNVDYGALGADERERRLSTDNYHIDSELLKGKTVIFIDDVKITGSHERRMEHLLEKSGFDGTVIFTYYAEFTGDGHPSIENYLNYNGIKGGLNSISEIKSSDGIRLNTRVTKFIFSQPEPDFNEFIRHKPNKFKMDLLNGMIGNDYHILDEFKGNVDTLRGSIKSNSLIKYIHSRKVSGSEV